MQEALQSELRLALSAQEELSTELAVKEAALEEALAGMGAAAAAREAQEREVRAGAKCPIKSLRIHSTLETPIEVVREHCLQALRDVN